MISNLSFCTDGNYRPLTIRAKPVSYDYYIIIEMYMYEIVYKLILIVVIIMIIWLLSFLSYPPTR